MADLDDIDPDDITVAHDDDTGVPDPNPDAAAEEDEDRVAQDDDPSIPDR